MPKIKDNLGYSQEELKKFYDEGRNVILKYKSVYFITFYEKEGFRVSLYQKTYLSWSFTPKGKAEFITLQRWREIRDKAIYRYFPF